MEDIDFELLSPTALEVDDAVLLRRGASAPNTGALAAPESIAAAAAFTGDVTKAAGDTVLTIAADAVGNDKLANMAFGTIKMRKTAGSGNPENGTGTELTAFLDLATTSLKGLAPARSGIATEYLDGTGAYSTPAGGGSGDVVGPASATDDAVSGFDGTTGKLIKAGSVTLTDLAAKVAEIIAARGDRPTLNDRLTAISSVTTPNIGGFVVGNHYDNAFRITASASLVGAADRMELYPFMVSQQLRIDRIGVECTTAAATAQGKCLIYGSGADGWPDDLLYETATPLDFSSTNYKFETVNHLFDRDRVYWLGVRHSLTATLRASSTSGALSLGVAAATGASYYTLLRRTLTFATAAPANWSFTSSDLAANLNVTLVRMRATTV